MLSFNEAVDLIHDTPLVRLRERSSEGNLILAASFINVSKKDKETPRSLMALFKLYCAFPKLVEFAEEHKKAHAVFFEKMRAHQEQRTFRWDRARENWFNLSEQQHQSCLQTITNLMSTSYGVTPPALEFEIQKVDTRVVDGVETGGHFDTNRNTLSIKSLISETDLPLKSFEQFVTEIKHEMCHVYQLRKIQRIQQDCAASLSIEENILGCNMAAGYYDPDELALLSGKPRDFCLKLYQNQPMEADAFRATHGFVGEFKELLHSHAGFDPVRDPRQMASLKPIDQITYHSLVCMERSMVISL